MTTNSRHAWLLACCMAAGTLTLGSCGTDDIDVEDIDATIGIGLQNLRLPGNNSTHEIVFDELFDIDTTGCIKIDPVSGEYIFRKEGDEVEPTTVTVNPITIVTDQDNIHPTPMEISPSELGITLPAKSRVGEAETAPALARRKVQTGIKELWETIQNFEFTETDLAGDVVDIHYAESSTNIRLVATFTNDLSYVLPQFTGLTFYLPEYLTLSDVRSNRGNVSTADGHTIVVENVSTNGRLVINASISKLDLHVASDPSLPAYLYYSREYHPLDDTYSGAVHLKGNVRMKAEFPEDIVRKTGLRADMKFGINTELNIDDIDIVSGTGRFCPSIELENIGDISIGNDVPSFLNDPAVRLDIDNPILMLDISSDLTIDGIIDGQLNTTYRSNTGYAPRSLEVPGIKAVHGRVSHIVLCNHNPNPSLYTEANGYQVVETERTGLHKLSWLLEKIPESITFGCTATADETSEGIVLLGHDYSIKPAYTFEARLALNQGSVFVYNDSVDDWNSDLKDLDLTLGTTILLESDVINKSPLDLSLDIIPVGLPKANGQRDILSNLIGVEVTTDKTGNKVTANGNSKLTVKVTQKQKGAFKQLDGLRIKATAVSQGSGQAINSGLGRNKTTQTLKLDRITITVNGQLEIDAN